MAVVGDNCNVRFPSNNINSSVETSTVRMSSSMGDAHSRKRSRWGDQEPQQKEHEPTSSVTDQEAINSLLISARARQEDLKQSSFKKQKTSREDKETKQDDEEPPQKANFGLSGALAQDERGGNVYKGVVLKFSEPPEARAPNTQWRLYVFKENDLLDTLHISKQSAYLIGRNAEIADVPVQHPSLSGQHAVLQYRALPNKETGKLNCQPYIMDLESTNGTYLNGVKIDAARYYQLKKGDTLKFGASTREYVLLTANTTSIK